LALEVPCSIQLSYGTVIYVRYIKISGIIIENKIYKLNAVGQITIKNTYYTQQFFIGAPGENRTPYLRVTNPLHRQQCFWSRILGAGDRDRTDDEQLGRLTLYH
jgi:hypothetical protein